MTENEFIPEIEERKNLANIRVIKSIESIKDADKIELVKFTDVCWQSVVKKGEFSVGQTVVYVQIDTILPDGASWAQFLKDKTLPGEPIRLRSAKLRGTLSQGIVLPLSVIPNYEEYTHEGILYRVRNCQEHDQEYEVSIEVGDDVTKILGIRKYEKPSINHHEARGSFPGFLRKTDEDRIQNYPRLIEEFQGKEVVITLKMDGTSGTFYCKNGEIGVASRNLDLKPQEGGKYWPIGHTFGIFEALKNLGNYCIQGEICGPAIQGNHIGLSTTMFYGFNLWNIDEQKFEDFDKLAEFCSKNNLMHAPVLYRGTFNYKSVDELLHFANQQLYPNNQPAEGIVVRLAKEEYSQVLKGRSSFKVISNVFALKNGE